MATGPLTEAEIVDVRRWCGFPAYGAGPSNDPFDRFFVAFMQAEYRIRNLIAPELVIVRAKLAEIAALDAAVVTAAENLDTNQAAVWHRNPNEVADRNRLKNMRCRELCWFLGIGPGPNLSASGYGVRTVV